MRNSYVCSLSRVAVLAAAVLLAAPIPAAAQRNLEVIPPPDPEIERQSFELPDGVEVNLFAADPAIAKPIQMSWDEQGRLWIASSETYPQIEPGQVANDKILVLEDLDKDGTADRTTVFADGLLIPTGILPGDGGAYVANSTELLHLSDTDGDGKADQRRVMLSGFGTEDTHHILHTFRRGPDGSLYFNQSIYIHSHIETIHGVKRLNAGGIWRYDPRSMNLNVFARGWINAWGHAFDRFGQSFVTDGAGGEGINYVIPGAAYPTAQGVPKIFHGLNPGSPKYCGLEVVRSPAFPSDWQNQLITHDFRGNRVCRFELEDAGAGFAARQLPDLIRSSHIAFRPVDVRMGPDGAIYIADWYNPIIQHGEVDFRDPRRDHVHGRIWRVTFKDRPPVEPINLAEASTAELLAQLESGNLWGEEQARNVLRERGPETLAAVREWHAAAEDQITAEQRALERLWAIQAAGQTDHAVLTSALAAEDGRIRAAGTRVLADWIADVPDAKAHLARLVHDEHPRVRLEAVRALARLNNAEMLKMALAVVDHPMDEFLDYALWLTLWETHNKWLPELARSDAAESIPAEQLVLALEAAGADQAVPLLLDLLREGTGTSDSFPVIAETVARLGSAAHFQQLLKLAAAADVKPQHKAAALSTLVGASRQRKIAAQASGEQLQPFLNDNSVAVRAAAIELAAEWNLPKIADRLQQILADDSQPQPVRLAAIRAFGRLQPNADPAPLISLLDADEVSVQMKLAALESLVQTAPRLAASRGITWIASATASDEQTLEQITLPFLKRRATSQVLAREVAQSQLPAAAAKVMLRAVSGSGSPHPELAEALEALAGSGDGWITLTPQQRQEILDDVATSGDPHRGEAVYRRDDLSCLTCHPIGGSGGNVGPDLLSLGSASQPDYILESLIDPNAKVKENFHTLVVVDLDGRIHTGIKIRETDREIVLRDAKAREVRVPLDQIDDTVIGSSLMPVGLVDRLTRQELIDLVAFLSVLGKRPEFSVGTEGKLRTWQVMQPGEQAAHRLRRTSFGQAALDDPAFTWKPLYSKVNGEVPLEDLPQVSSRLPFGPFQSTAFLRSEVEVPPQGTLSLRFNDVSGLRLWVDADPVPIRDTVRLQVSPGRHRVTLALDKQARSQPLIVDVETPPADK